MFVIRESIVLLFVLDLICNIERVSTFSADTNLLTSLQKVSTRAYTRQQLFNKKPGKSDDEMLFQELYEEHTSVLPEDTKNYDMLSYIVGEIQTHEVMPLTGFSTNYDESVKLKPLSSSAPDRIVHHILTAFAENLQDDDEIKDDALEEAFKFTSIQEFNDIYPRVPSPMVRKSWKWGQPTEHVAVEFEKRSNTCNEGVSEADFGLHEGVPEADFGRELEKEYNFLLGCDSFRFVSPPVLSGSDRLCHIDVLVERVESTKPNFYDKGVGTFNVVRTFRFNLERSTCATYYNDAWMIYNVKRIGFGFHKSQKPTNTDI